MSLERCQGEGCDHALCIHQRQQAEEIERLRALDLSALERFDLVPRFLCYQTVEEMEQVENGDWVRFEDVVELLRRSGLQVAPVVADGK